MVKPRVRALIGRVEDGRRAGRRERQSLAARALALAVLDEIAPGRGWRIESGADGRPLARDGEGRAGPDLSLAHSGGWAAAAVAGAGVVGIDIEVPRPGRDLRAIAEAYFTPAEQAAVAGGGEAAFLACWTLREAIAKAGGGGIGTALALDGSRLVGAVGGSASLMVAGRRWALVQRGAPGLQLALAWSGPAAAAALAAVRAAGARAWAATHAPT